MSDNYGTLVIKTFAANEAVPIPSSKVTIRGAEGVNSNIIRFILTDKDGITEDIKLPAPNITYSLTPNSKIQPYSRYDVKIEKEGYYDKTIQDVPIFAGIKAVLPVNMIPLTESEISNTENSSVISENENLYKG